MMKLLVDGDAPRNAADTQFELEGWIDAAPFEQLLGLVIERAGDGEAVLRLPFTVKLAQGGGLMHGGALTTLADTAVAMAIKSVLPVGTRFATTEMCGRFLAPVREGVVTARARISGPDGRTFHGTAELVDEDDRQVMTFEATFRVARGQEFADATDNT